jgi:microcystin-dependent protein
MSNYEATKYDYDGANLVGIEGIPTATIIPWSDSSIPSGFLECDGSGVSRTTYSALFAIIGTTYGSGNGSTTFNIPDLQDNILIGKSDTKAVGSTGGANTVTKTGNVGGSSANATITESQLASHSHSGSAVFSPPPGSTPETQGNNRANPNPNIGNSGGSGSHSHNMSANFIGDATSVLQPYLTVLYIIKT